MARVLFHVVQDHVLVRAEDGPGQAVLDGDRDLRQLLRVGTRGGGKEQTFILFVVQQDGGSFTFQQFHGGGGDQPKQVVEIEC